MLKLLLKLTQSQHLVCFATDLCGLHDKSGINYSVLSSQVKLVLI